MKELEKYKQVRKDAKYIQEKIRKKPPKNETQIIQRTQPKMAELDRYIRKYQSESNPVKRKMYLNESQKIIEDLKLRYSFKYRIKNKFYNLLSNII